MTRDDIRNTASTLAHHWVGGDTLRDREGVRRIILSHAVDLRPVLCAHVLRYLELRGWYTQAERFESMLFDLADLPDDGTPSDLKGLHDDIVAARSLAELEQGRA